MLCGCLSLLYISVMAVSDASVMSALARCLSPVIALVWSRGGVGASASGGRLGAAGLRFLCDLFRVCYFLDFFIFVFTQYGWLMCGHLWLREKGEKKEGRRVRKTHKKG